MSRDAWILFVWVPLGLAFIILCGWLFGDLDGQPMSPSSEVSDAG